MLKKTFTALLFLTGFKCFAQPDYFVLIQADNNQPFYVLLSNNTFSSDELGHLIIPKLKDSVYTFTIGFPKEAFPAEKFAIAINKKDQSFQLKNLAEKGWGLFNTSTMELKMPEKPDAGIPSKPDHSGFAKKEDAFSRLMAGVVNDTSVMYNSYIEEQPKTETAHLKKIKPAAIKTDSPVADNVKLKLKDSVKKETAAIPPSVKKVETKIHKTDSVNNGVVVAKPPLYRPRDPIAASKRPSFVKKLTEQKTDTAVHLVYADVLNKGGIDTVDVFIPLNQESYPVPSVKDIAKRDIGPAEQTELKKTKDTVLPVVMNQEKENIMDSVNKDTTAKAEIKTPAASALTNTCSSSATDYDIDKLRVKMLGIDNDDDKILAAKSIFKVKCFSVKQVNALSEVFKTDEGKYKLFDEVYAHVSDAGNFIQLQQALADPYYINRFKAMIR